VCCKYYITYGYYRRVFSYLAWFNLFPLHGCAEIRTRGRESTTLGGVVAAAHSRLLAQTLPVQTSCTGSTIFDWSTIFATLEGEACVVVFSICALCMISPFTLCVSHSDVISFRPQCESLNIWVSSFIRIFNFRDSVVVNIVFILCLFNLRNYLKLKLMSVYKWSFGLSTTETRVLLGSVVNRIKLFLYANLNMTWFSYSNLIWNPEHLFGCLWWGLRAVPMIKTMHNV
jgi:hypothetical protein